VKIAAWMVTACIAGWLVVAAMVPGRQTPAAALAGMAGPLAMAAGSWVLAERTFRRNPERLTGVMAALFVAKMVFVALYVAVVVRVMAVPAVPFAISFTAYFIGLYSVEAVCLRRLFARDAGNVETLRS
jgi:hypothetical protein